MFWGQFSLWWKMELFCLGVWNYTAGLKAKVTAVFSQLHSLRYHYFLFPFASSQNLDMDKTYSLTFQMFASVIVLCTRSLTAWWWQQDIFPKSSLWKEKATDGAKRVCDAESFMSFTQMLALCCHESIDIIPVCSLPESWWIINRHFGYCCLPIQVSTGTSIIFWGPACRSRYRPGSNSIWSVFKRLSS